MTAKTAIGYIRVSTDEQANEGVSLSAQEARVRAHCAARGIELVEVIVDAGVSASKPLARRPGGKSLLDAVAAGKAQVVVALKLDRLFRNARDGLAVSEAWDRKNVGLVLLDMGGDAVDTSTPMGKFFFHMMAGVAEMERNMIAERTASALRHKKARGEKTGGQAPIGFAAARPEGKPAMLVADQSESAAVARMMQLHAGKTPVRKIADILDQEGFKPRGKRWHPTTVARIIARQKESN